MKFMAMVFSPRTLLIALFTVALAIGTAGLAQAEPRDVNSPEYQACIDKGMAVDGATYPGVIDLCCFEAGGETLNDSNGDAYNCVTYDEVENSTQPPPTKPAVIPPKVSQPGLAPPATPTTTPPVVAPAPAPGLAPR